METLPEHRAHVVAESYEGDDQHGRDGARSDCHHRRERRPRKCARRGAGNEGEDEQEQISDHGVDADGSLICAAEAPASNGSTSTERTDHHDAEQHEQTSGEGGPDPRRHQEHKTGSDFHRSEQRRDNGRQTERRHGGTGRRSTLQFCRSSDEENGRRKQGSGGSEFGEHDVVKGTAVCAPSGNREAE